MSPTAAAPVRSRATGRPGADRDAAGARARSSGLATLLIAGLALGAAGEAPTLAQSVPSSEPAVCKRFESRLPGADQRSDATNAVIDTPAPRADDRGVDILSYDLELTLDPTPGPVTGQINLTGRIDIGLRALRAGVDTLVLDLVPELVCDAASRRGLPLTVSRNAEELRLPLPGDLSLAAPETVTIAWHGRPPRHGNLYAGLMYRRDDGGTPGDSADDVPFMFSISEPWSAHAWWPCKDHPSDKALVSLAATVPADLSVVGNGTLESVGMAGPNWRRFVWRERYPLPTYLVSVAASRYEIRYEDCRPAHVAPVPLEYHVIARDRTAAEVLLGRTCAMTDVLSGLLGPYPFAGEKYAQVEVVWGGAMEHTTATSLGQFQFTGDRRYEQVVVHELAHQWFGDSLTPARWSDIWLNEGFATYAEALWLELSEGSAARETFLRRIGSQRHPALFAGEGTLAAPSPVLPNTLVYDKGAWVLHLLRGVVGDEAFFRFLRDYAGDPALTQGSVTTEAMIARAEAASGRDLEAFFDGWLRTDAVPVLSLERTGRPGSSRDGSVAVRLRQHQTPSLTLPVPLLLHTDAGAIGVTAVLTAPWQDFHWRPGAAVDSVTVDPGRATLVRWLAQPAPLLSVAAPRPNPAATATVSFDLILRESSQVTVRIYDARGALIATPFHGTVPATPDGAAPWIWRWQPPAGVPPLPAGTYWFAFEAGGQRVVKPLTLVH